MELDEAIAQITALTTERDALKADVDRLTPLAGEAETHKANHTAATDQLAAALAEKSNLSAQVQALSAQVGERDEAIKTGSGRYRDAVIKARGLDAAADVVVGDSFDAIDQAAERAAAIVERVKASVAGAGAGTTTTTTPAPPAVPNGGATRQTLDLSAAPAIDKIKAGVEAALASR